MKLRPFRQWFSLKSRFVSPWYERIVGVFFQLTIPEGFNVCLGLWFWRVDFACIFGVWKDAQMDRMAEAERKRMRKLARNHTS